MKLPSFQHLSQSFGKVIKRFPVQVLIAILASIFWCYYIQIDNNYNEPDNHIILKENLIKALLSLNLALLLTLALDLFSEQKALTGFKKQFLRLGAIAFCILLFFLIDLDNSGDYLRILFLSFSFHLLIAYAPFTGKGKMNGFWQFNKSLFLRILTAVLYSGVIFIGLAAALAAIDALFNTSINDETYLSLFAIIAAGFNTIFFLAGLPSDYDALNEDNSYPKGLKLFTQFVLIPLMTIYLGILLVYEIKIIILWQMPKGMVSSLILGYAVFGILSLLLVHPIKESIGNNWIKFFSRLFYIMMIPLLVLLILAIWKRVGHYGITESRYILMVLTLWLSGMTIYFLFGKTQNIKVIPISLSIIALLAVYGPQSAFSVSKYSQLARFKKMKPENKEDRRERNEIIEYLVGQHGLQSLQPLTTVNLKPIEQQIDSKENYSYLRRSAKIDTAFKILKVAKTDEYSDETPYLQFTNEQAELVPITGYDFIMDITEYSNITKDLNGEKLKLSSQNPNQMILSLDEKELLHVDLTKLFKDAFSDYKKGILKEDTDFHEYFYPNSKMSFSQSTLKYKFTIVLSTLSGNSELISDKPNYAWVYPSGYLLIKKL